MILSQPCYFWNTVLDTTYNALSNNRSYEDGMQMNSTNIRQSNMQLYGHEESA